MEFVLYLLALILILAVIITVRTVMFVRAGGEKTSLFKSKLPDPQLDTQKIAKHLSATIQVETISYEDPGQNRTENFDKLHGLRCNSRRC